MLQQSNFRPFRPQHVSEFYKMLQLEVRLQFRDEVMLNMDWGRSTFYNRIEEKKKMKKIEHKRFMRIVHKYAHQNNIRLNF